ncbi:MAG: ABC transporter ATP-binding protein [Alphaproteobacteria bacterium]|nr:MAG: ABC transporter ATP-binding protein [Alphaproteobacteria bacterium]
MASLYIKNVTKDFGPVRAIDNLSLAIEGPELIALLGPSGCGKTTLLRMIAGFVEATSGRIRIGERDVTDVPPNLRNTGMIFQSYALFPHMTVAENVGFGLEMRKIAKDERMKRVREALSLVHLNGYEDRYPKQMSGGQRQRVAIARALVIRPDVFLLDEPLSNLDAVLRQSVGNEIRELQQRLGLTSVFVTHDQKEALMLADRLVVMKAGRIIQEGSGSDIYNHPNCRFVASFLGKSNFFEGHRQTGGSFTTAGGLTFRCPDSNLADGASALLSVRPESIRLGPEASKLDNTLEAKVAGITYLGSLTEVELGFPGSDNITVQLQNRPGAEFRADIGAAVLAGWTAGSAHLIADHGES